MLKEEPNISGYQDSLNSLNNCFHIENIKVELLDLETFEEFDASEEKTVDKSLTKPCKVMLERCKVNRYKNDASSKQTNKADEDTSKSKNVKLINKNPQATLT